MDAIEDGAIASGRRPLDGITEAFSGARLEQAIRPGGDRVVLKYLPREGDWLTRATGGLGRLRHLWESGMLGRVQPLVDHTILEIREVSGEDVVVMRDASDDLLPPKEPVSTETSLQLLAGLAGMHDGFANETAQGLCSIASRYAMFAPTFHHSDDGPGRHPLSDRIDLGWELFAEHVDSDVVEAIFAVHRAPDVLERRLEQFPPTLLHGDAKLENLGLSPAGKLVAIDWGDLTGVGPCEVDVAWYALKGSVRIGRSPDALFVQYERARGRPLDPDATDLACLGSLAQMGFRFAVGAFASGPEPAEIAVSQLDWWIARVRDALDRIGW